MPAPDGPIINTLSPFARLSVRLKSGNVYPKFTLLNIISTSSIERLFSSSTSSSIAESNNIASNFSLIGTLIRISFQWLIAFSSGLKTLSLARNTATNSPIDKYPLIAK